MRTTRIVRVAVLMVASAFALHVLWAEQAGNRPANENREEQSNNDERKSDHADRSKNSTAAPHGACRGRTPIPAVGAGGAGCGSVLHHRAKRRSQYIYFLRDLQVASSTGFPSAAGLH